MVLTTSKLVTTAWGQFPLLTVYTLFLRLSPKLIEEGVCCKNCFLKTTDYFLCAGKTPQEQLPVGD